MRQRLTTPILRPGLFLACSAALLAPALLGAQKIRQDDVAEVIVVEVPVQVTKDGKPVRGLTPEQFELFDGRRFLVITTFVGLPLFDRAAPAPPGVGSSRWGWKYGS